MEDNKKELKKPKKPEFKKTFPVSSAANPAEVEKAVEEAKKTNSVYELNIADIQNPNFHDRKNYQKSDVENLANNIKRIGLIHPVAVRKLPDGRFERVSGFMRIEAVKLLGRKTIQAVILTVSDSSEASFAMLSENIHRKNLNPYDEVKAFVEYVAGCLGVSFADMLALINRFANADTGRVKELDAAELELRALFEQKLSELGKYTFASFRRKLSVLNMHEEIVNALKNNEISYSFAQLLHTLRKNEDAMLNLLNRCKKGEFESKTGLSAAIKEVLEPKAKASQLSNSLAIVKKRNGVYKLSIKEKKLSDHQKALLQNFLDSIS